MTYICTLHSFSSFWPLCVYRGGGQLCTKLYGDCQIWKVLPTNKQLSTPMPRETVLNNDRDLYNKRDLFSFYFKSFFNFNVNRVILDKISPKDFKHFSKSYKICFRTPAFNLNDEQYGLVTRLDNTVLQFFKKICPSFFKN